MSTHPPVAAIHHAVAVDSTTNDDKPKVDMIPRSSSSPTSDWIFSRYMFSSLFGLLVGLFIQCMTFGANVLAIAVWGEDLILKSSKFDILLVSLAWSCFSSIVILGLFRNLHAIASHAVVVTEHHRQRQQQQPEEEEEVLCDDTVVLHIMECRFAVGVLVGVCLAWTVTDALFGTRGQMIFSLITLVVTFFTCVVMMYCVAKKEEGKHEPRKNKDLEEPLLIV